MECGDEFVQAMEEVEKRFPMTLNALRSLASLCTRKWMLEACHAIKHCTGNLHTLEKQINELIHKQWVEFHWTEENPNISKDIRMFTVFLFPCCCVNAFDNVTHI